MLILIGVLLGLFVIVALGTWLSNKYSKKNPDNKEEEQALDIPLDCCGAHEICDFDEMRMNPDEIVYFEDEELDNYQGIDAGKYNDQQIEEFRDVLYTLKGDEIKMWLLSIERRQIQLPTILRSEAIMLAAECDL